MRSNDDAQHTFSTIFRKPQASSPSSKPQPSSPRPQAPDSQAPDFRFQTTGPRLHAPGPKLQAAGPRAQAFSLRSQAAGPMRHASGPGFQAPEARPPPTPKPQASDSRPVPSPGSMPRVPSSTIPRPQAQVPPQAPRFKTGPKPQAPGLISQAPGPSRSVSKPAN